MQAVVLTEYGGPEVMSLRDVPDPPVGPDWVLVRVHAAGVNPVDCKIRAGRLRGAFTHHTPLIPGWDLAGEVVSAGPAVTDFIPGDRVFAYARKDHVQYGTYAQLAALPERMLARAPHSCDDLRAAALPLAGLTALQALRAARARAGDRVLVHAAAGGVGHLAVQIAVALGARPVIGTASPANHDFLRSLGAEPIAYGPDLVERIGSVVGGDGRVDVALDLVAGPALEQSARLVRDPGRHVSVVDPSVLQRGGRYVFVRPDAAQLTWLAELVDAGRLHVDVAHAYPLAEAVAAHRRVEEGHVRGKIVLAVPR